MSNSRRKLWRLFRLALTNLVVFFLLCFGIHALYVKKITPESFDWPEINHEAITPELTKRLGLYDYTRKESSFLNFSFQKESSEKIRIGFFGGSHVYGEEVDQDSDFPTQLQNLLGEDFEVLNFGMGWFSMSQTYIMWKEFHEKYHLDLVVFGPRLLEFERSLTFNHSMDYSPLFFHSRFIVRDEELFELEPLGSSPKERFDRYYSFLPPQRYWFYDIRPPSFFRALQSFLNLQIRNPFYYKQDIDQEMRDLNRLVLEGAVEKSPRFLLLLDETEAGSLERLARKVEGLGKEDILVLNPIFSKGVPFVAAKWHASAYGNRVRAYEIYEWLRAIYNLPLLTEQVVPIIQEETLEGPIWDDFVYGGSTPFDQLELVLNDQKIGRLTSAVNLIEDPGLGDPRSLDLDGSEVLIGLICGDGGPAHSVFVIPERWPDLLTLNEHQRKNLSHYPGYPNLLFMRLGKCSYDSLRNEVRVPLDHPLLSIQNETYQMSLAQAVVLVGHHVTPSAEGAYIALKPQGRTYKMIVESQSDQEWINHAPGAINRLQITAP